MMQEQLLERVEHVSKRKAGKTPADYSKTRAFFQKADNIFANELKNDATLKEKFNADGTIKRHLISDAFTAENIDGKTIERPIIDLVQQGGGMFGIALLGYTYILEKVGIRFYSHGGTSAGAINALFLASVPQSIYLEDSKLHESRSGIKATKSELLTHIIAQKDFSEFMERKGVVGWFQEKLFKNFKSLWLKLLLVLLSLMFLVGVYSAFGLIFNSSNGLSGSEIRFYDFIVGTLNVLALTIVVYIVFVKVLGKDFGINKGDEFFDWADELLESLDLKTTNELENRMQEVELNDPKEGDKPRLVLITSNLTHQRIVKFPEKAKNYWENHGNIRPASYLRATMSLPFIFETFIPSRRHFRNANNPENTVKLEARFVDGGMLSNFPIREFHRKDNAVPRFPTFGVLLSKRESDMQAGTGKSKLAEKSLLGYIGSFIKTFRNFYDNDYLFSNDETSSRVETVDTEGINWLNFWMDDDDKLKLFEEGAKAAIRQLKKFDFEDYKKTRAESL